MELKRCLQNHKTMAITIKFISNGIFMLARKSLFYVHKYDCLCQLYILTMKLSNFPKPCLTIGIKFQLYIGNQSWSSNEIAQEIYV
jgi:hypothetical protein